MRIVEAGLDEILLGLQRLQDDADGELFTFKRQTVALLGVPHCLLGDLDLLGEVMHPRMGFDHLADDLVVALARLSSACRRRERAPSCRAPSNRPPAPIFQDKVTKVSVLPSKSRRAEPALPPRPPAKTCAPSVG